MNDSIQLHGTAVAVEGACALLIGASGSGKSAIALQMIALGAELVGDDQVIVSSQSGYLQATGMPGFEGKIEARGVGILSVPYCASARLECVVDLDQTELQRLPPERNHEILGISVNLILGRDAWGLAAALFLRLKGRRLA